MMEARWRNLMRRRELILCRRYAAVLAPFSSSSFLPSIPAISQELNTTATILNITVAVFIVVIGICPLVWSNYAGVCAFSPARFATSH